MLLVEAWIIIAIWVKKVSIFILVYGHTHRSYVDEMSKTANTGSWGRNGDDSDLDYMIIEDGKPELHTYEF